MSLKYCYPVQTPVEANYPQGFSRAQSVGIQSQWLEWCPRGGSVSARQLGHRTFNVERCSRRGGSRLDGSHELLAKLNLRTSSRNHSGFRVLPPGHWSSNPTQGKGSEKAMSYTNTSRGKEMTSGKVLSSVKGSSTGKGEVQMLTSDQKAPPPVNRSGRKCGYCHSQGKDGNHDLLRCSFRNEGRDQNTTK